MNASVLVLFSLGRDPWVGCRKSGCPGHNIFENGQDKVNIDCMPIYNVIYEVSIYAKMHDLEWSESEIQDFCGRLPWNSCSHVHMYYILSSYSHVNCTKQNNNCVHSVHHFASIEIYSSIAIAQLSCQSLESRSSRALWSGVFACWFVRSFVHNARSDCSNTNFHEVLHRCWASMPNVTANLLEVKVKV